MVRRINCDAVALSTNVEWTGQSEALFSLPAPQNLASGS